jgi:hypothetical protein
MTLARVALVGSLVALTACGNISAGTGTPSAPVPSAAGSEAPDPSPRQAPYLVAAPLLGTPSGPAALPQPACTPRTVSATSTTKELVGGVAGVITLDGTGCSLHITGGPTSLLDATGHPLEVTLDAAQPKVNPPQNIRPDLALLGGHALWGFTWTGSWCGPAAATIVVPMADDPAYGAGGTYGDLHIPFTGPQPACHGSSDSVLRAGVAGSGTQPVLPAPPAWASLTAAVSIPVTVGTRVPPYTLTLTNPTSTPILLSPCPEYGSLVSVSRAGPGSPSGSDSIGPGVLECPSPAVVPPHGSLALQLPEADFDQGAPQPYPSGSAVTVEVAISGVATARAVAHVG